MRFLLVEDDPMIGDTLRAALRMEGHAVDWVRDAAAAEATLASEAFDLVLLDLGLPQGDGLQVLRGLRARGNATPVIVLTARDGPGDRVAGLDAGADDYLVKPFGAAELLARVRAQLRRQALAPLSAQPVLRFGRTTVDLARRVVERDGEPMHLTPIEYRLLTQLASQPDRVITHQQLLKAVWGPGHAEDTHYVRVHMANLRKKVEDDASMPRHLLTEAGIGYRFRP